MLIHTQLRTLPQAQTQIDAMRAVWHLFAEYEFTKVVAALDVAATLLRIEEYGLTPPLPPEEESDAPEEDVDESDDDDEDDDEGDEGDGEFDEDETVEEDDDDFDGSTPVQRAPAQMPTQMPPAPLHLARLVTVH